MDDDEKVEGYISEIEFNNGQKVNINKDDIVVFVGANNVGKSQSLKDIFTLCEDKLPTKVIKDIKVTKNFDNLESYLNEISNVKEMGGGKEYSSFGFSAFISDNGFKYLENNYSYSTLKSVFVTNLGTENRLTIVNPTEIINRDKTFYHPIHFAAYDNSKGEWLSDNFKKAFGKEITANIMHGKTIPLCIGDRIDVMDFFKPGSNIISLTNDIAKKLENYDLVNEQGDGIKSFTGILLYLMIDRYSTFLIDEPESFLHPPQAKIMGKIIGESLSDSQQAFISTHSEELIKGLLEVSSSRVKIIRIEREGDKNKVSTLENNDINATWNDPLLKYSNILSGLFHNQVVICESDSDCKLYSMINDYLKEKEETYSETLFIHTGGKQRISKIVNALRLLNVKVKVIVDIDILKNEKDFRELIEQFGINWDNDINSNYKILSNQINTKKNEIRRDSLKTLLESITNIKDTYVTDNEIKTIKDYVRKTTKWDEIKKIGINAIPNGDAREAFNKIQELIESVGIFVVLEGELEGFIRDVGGHGPEWVTRVLENHPDFSEDVYDKVREFISKMDL